MLLVPFIKLTGGGAIAPESYGAPCYILNLIKDCRDNRCHNAHIQERVPKVDLLSFFEELLIASTVLLSNAVS